MLRVGDTFGDYRVTGSLGAGGMGVVHTAHHLRLDRAVALKVLPSALADDPSFRRRFLRESSTLARLDSPHVIHVYDHGEIDGRLYLVTQLVGGGDLAQRLRRTGPMPPAAALDLAAQVASALADAHDSGILHRDVKPSNVLLRDAGGEVFGYLCDFGIATRIGPGAEVHQRDDEPQTELTETGVVVGTYAYLAPERSADGAPASVASDVYSLGCVLWAMLSGAAPYQGSSAVQVALRHVQAPVPQLPPGHPWARVVDPVLARAMAKDPAARHASAADLRADLLAALRRGPATSQGTDEADDLDAIHGDTVLHPVGRSVAAAVEPVATADTELRPAAPPRTVAGGPAAHRPPPRRPGVARKVAAVVAVAALVAVGGVVAILRLAEDSTPADATSAATSSLGEVATTPTGDTSAAPTTAPTAAPATATSPAPADRSVTCWDGRQSDSRKACGRPTGTTGLTWVFPSFDPSGCRQTYELDRPTVWECTIDVDGSPVYLRYSQLVATTDARARYNEEYGASARETVDEAGRAARYVWRAAEPNDAGAYRLSTMYVDYPYSMSITAATPALRDAALADRISFRAPQDVLGTS